MKYTNMEKWKDIKGFEGYYKISNTGRVLSLERDIFNGKGFRKTKKIYMKTYDNGFGYLRVCLRKDNYHKFYLIHRLIAEHFINNPNNYPIINHKDGNKQNNNINNLEWCDFSWNNKHGFKTGLIKSLNGEKHPKSKLKEIDVLKIKELLKDNKLNQKKIAEKFNINSRTINGIKTGKIWKHL